MPISGKVLYPFRWFFRPEATPFASPASIPVVRVQEAQDLSPEQIPSILREINDRQWSTVLDVLLEAKYKAEAQLRNDTVFNEPGRVAFYQGWVAYCDYIIASLQGLRTQNVVPEPGPKPGPE
jgi:hypothetical protein